MKVLATLALGLLAATVDLAVALAQGGAGGAGEGGHGSSWGGLRVMFGGDVWG